MGASASRNGSNIALNSRVASYVCTDDFLQLDVMITYTPGKVPIVASLTTCRANPATEQHETDTKPTLTHCSMPAPSL